MKDQEHTMTSRSQNELNERWYPFYRAFYGEDFDKETIGQDKQLHEKFKKLVNTIKTDIEDKLSVPNQKICKNATLSALQGLHAAGVQEPGGYKVPAFAREAMLWASTVVAKARSVERTKEMLKDLDNETPEDIREKSETAQEKKVRLYAEFDVLVEESIGTGLEPESAKIPAYIELISQYPHPEGVEYYILSMKLPIDHGIYENEDVIKAMQEHPSFRKIGRKVGGPKMTINGQRYDPAAALASRRMSTEHLTIAEKRKAINRSIQEF